MQEDKEHCYICGKNGYSDPLDCHHIFSGINRKNSEKYGLTVYLCHYACHIFGADSVHQSKETADLLKEQGQIKAMQYYGWSKEDFIKIFGKNYILKENDND